MNGIDFAEFLEQAGAGPALATLRASPGPSWGWNGVHTLVATPWAIWFIQAGARDTSRLSLILRTDVTSVESEQRGGLLGTDRVTTIRLVGSRSRKNYTTKYNDEALRFVRTLDEGAG